MDPTFSKVGGFKGNALSIEFSTVLTMFLFSSIISLYTNNERIAFIIMTENSFVLLGNIIYSENKDTLKIFENSYAVCVDGVSKGVFAVLPDEYKSLPLIDRRDCIIIPGMTDLHVHAPQYGFRSVGMDCELLEWLEAHAFPEESKYADTEYAKMA